MCAIKRIVVIIYLNNLFLFQVLNAQEIFVLNGNYSVYTNSFGNKKSLVFFYPLFNNLHSTSQITLSVNYTTKKINPQLHLGFIKQKYHNFELHAQDTNDPFIPKTMNITERSLYLSAAANCSLIKTKGHQLNTNLGLGCLAPYWITHYFFFKNGKTRTNHSYNFSKITTPFIIIGADYNHKIKKKWQLHINCKMQVFSIFKLKNIECSYFQILPGVGIGYNLHHK